MIYWIKRGRRIFGSTVFFAVLIGMMIRGETWRYPQFMTAFLIALSAGAIGWFIGAIVCDIVLKGICADIGDSDPDTLVEGGMVQRLQMMKEEYVPGGAEMPFFTMQPATKSAGAKKIQERQADAGYMNPERYRHVES